MSAPEAVKQASNDDVAATPEAVADIVAQAAPKTAPEIAQAVPQVVEAAEPAEVESRDVEAAPGDAEKNTVEVIAAAEDVDVAPVAEAAQPEAAVQTNAAVEVTQPDAVEPAADLLPSEATIATAPAGNGLTDDGRANNDPRIDPKPIENVAIDTRQIALFSDSVAPAVEPSGQNVPRATNDPRGPLQQDQDSAAQS